MRKIADDGVYSADLQNLERSGIVAIGAPGSGWAAVSAHVGVAAVRRRL
jgi:hypothetical protein